MNETADAVRSCMEQLLLARDEKERLIIEATNKVCSEQKKTLDLQEKFEDANKQFEKVITENYNLHNSVSSNEKLMEELKESKAHLDQKLIHATARLVFAQKQCTSLKYEVRMIQEELDIRNKEREYDLKSLDAAQKQQQESMKKITSLEAECQRLRTMVRKRLPGPTALTKMKDEVKRPDSSSAENGMRRPHAAVQPQLWAKHSMPEGYQTKMQELGEENKHLRQILAQKDNDLQFVQSKYVDEACKISILQRQHVELSGSHGLTDNNHPEPTVSALAKLEHSRSVKQHVPLIRNRNRRIAGSDMQLLVDPLELEKLERASRPSSAPHQCADSPDTDSKMIVSETFHRDLIADDSFSDKYPEWIYDVLKVIIHKHQVSKVSVDVILDEVTHALRSEISAKGNGDAHLSYDRAEIHKMVGTLIARIRSVSERSTKNNVMRSLSLSHEKSELTLRLDHLVHVCSDVLDGKANLEMLTDEVCLILEWIVSQCFLCFDGTDIVDYNKNNSDGILRTLSIHEKDAMRSIKSEMVLGTQQEMLQGSVETTEDLIPNVTLENHSQIELITSTLDEDLLSVRQEQGDRRQGQHLVCCEAESSVSDGSKEKFAEQGGKPLTTTSAISAAARKLAECQETMANLSKQLRALESPAIADASDKEKCGTLLPSAANLVAEADPNPRDFSAPSPEEATSKKEDREPDATKRSLEHEQDSSQSPKAGKSGPTTVVVRPTVPKSPRASVSVDAKKKKRRANLLSRLVFRKKA